MFDDSNLISNLNQTNIEHDISEVKNSRERKLEKDIIQKLVNPEDKFGLPPMSLDEGEDDVCKTDVWEKVPKAPLSSKTTVIIDGIFIINTSPLASHQTFGDYAGGFDDDRKDRAISILNGQVVDYDLASANHEEADTRVWLHASVTTADQVIIYSPDTDKVEKTIEWYIKGCGCKTGCKTNRCKFEKAQNDNCDGFCGPGCKCVNCFNVPGSGDQVLDMSIDLDDVISDETEDLEDPVEDEQPEVDGLVEELDQKDDYWLFRNTTTTEESFTQAQTPVKYNLPVSVNLRQQFNIKKSKKENLSIFSCIKIGNTLVFTDYDNKRLIICNSDGTDIHHIPLSYTPYYMTEVNINTVAVSCHNKTIPIINISTGSVTRTINTSGSCYGISYNDNNLYVVIDQSIIHVMDLTGKVIRTIPLPSGLILDITVDRDRLVCIGYRSIYCCSIEGKLIWKFKKDNFQDLNHVTTDDEGNVYVTHYKTNTVIVVSDDGKHYRKFLLNQMD
ncbi:unnamed protein product [Mytilus coruscus]|uniref:Tesmin/TSO1-like CXC domain-containing protein n=1 Tax=Mytilus coruscus TaxID=42192 RepID=A0A6J8DDH6_MYTCO|nr:unnamed protein product [Mytilus coruscus]